MIKHLTPYTKWKIILNKFKDKILFRKKKKHIIFGFDFVHLYPHLLSHQLYDQTAKKADCPICDYLEKK